MHNGNRKRKGQPKREELDPSRTPRQAGGYDESILDHVRVVTSLIEGRKVSRQEVLEMLEREKKRQQGIHEDEKTDYPARELTEDSS
jgi:hypothetical protein